MQAVHEPFYEKHCFLLFSCGLERRDCANLELRTCEAHALLMELALLVIYLGQERSKLDRTSFFQRSKEQPTAHPKLIPVLEVRNGKIN